ncbi:AraC family transcriptional regulator [Klebsiella pneumoniae]|nr:AraC family transcriptional regulator [Klebsiella pneumoniae]
MIGVSDAAPPRAVNQPELAVDELSQICEGLARQRPENMPALLNALALIAPLLNAIPNVVFFIKDRQARYLLANLTLARRCGFKSVSSLLGKNLRRCLSFRAGSGLYRTGSSGTTGRRDPARSAGNASLQWPRARLVP